MRSIWLDVNDRDRRFYLSVWDGFVHYLRLNCPGPAEMNLMWFQTYMNKVDKYGPKCLESFTDLTGLDSPQIVQS